jgi:hypothetical protein
VALLNKKASFRPSAALILPGLLLIIVVQCVPGFPAHHPLPCHICILAGKRGVGTLPCRLPTLMTSAGWQADWQAACTCSEWRSAVDVSDDVYAVKQSGSPHWRGILAQW